MTFSNRISLSEFTFSNRSGNRIHVCIYYLLFKLGTRNTGTAIAGKNIANPVAMLNASVDMLYFLGHKTYADAISNSIRKTIVEDKIHTPGAHELIISFVGIPIAYVPI